MKGSSGTKQRVLHVLSVTHSTDAPGRAVRWTLTWLIILNVAAAIIQTVDWIERDWGEPLHVFECFSVAVFTIEYILRIWSCTADPRYPGAIRGRIRFIFTPLAMIDLLAIGPFYLSSFFYLDLRMLRAIRLARLLRGLKIARYSESVRLLWRVIVGKREELLVTFVAVTVILVIASTAMFYVERDAQPEIFSSIPAAMWWGVGSLTTAGAGDMIPVTILGRILNAVILLLGIGLFALPAGILASGFVEELHRKHSPERKCPHCGKVLEDAGGK